MSARTPSCAAADTRGRAPSAAAFALGLIVAIASLAGLPAQAADTPATKARPPSTKAAPPASSRAAPARAGAARAPSPAAPPANRQNQQTLQREQRELQTELARLKRQLAASESSRSEAADALASSERAISDANRRLRELAQARDRVEQQLRGLAEREARVAGHQEGERRLLDLWLLEQHRLALRAPAEVRLGSSDPDAASRDTIYLSYLQLDSNARLSTLATRRAELVDLREQTEQKRAELATIADDETKSRKILEIEQGRRKLALDQLGKQIATQRRSIAKLERDDARLGTLIDRISTALAEQARREAERERQKAEKAAAARAAARKPTPPPASAATRPADQHSSIDVKAATSSSNFAELKGKLLLPVQGNIAGRFGGPRRGDDGAAGPAWKGVFIRASAGSDVRAVGAGQVVFSDWLRGFGNLLVIDHGDGYLSVYGNNETLLRNAGDRVAVGEVVASVGNTGGNETPGLYFELRFQGRPFDPLTWVATR